MITIHDAVTLTIDKLINLINFEINPSSVFMPSRSHLLLRRVTDGGRNILHIFDITFFVVCINTIVKQIDQQHTLFQCIKNKTKQNKTKTTVNLRSVPSVFPSFVDMAIQGPWPAMSWAVRFVSLKNHIHSIYDWWSGKKNPSMIYMPFNKATIVYLSACNDWCRILPGPLVTYSVIDLFFISHHNRRTAVLKTNWYFAWLIFIPKKKMKNIFVFPVIFRHWESISCWNSTRRRTGHGRVYHIITVTL